MEFEKQLKYKTILAVMIILIGLSTIYFVIGIKNQKRYRDWNIQKDNDIVTLEVNNLLNRTYSIYKDKINYFVLNHQIKESFAKNDVEKLYKKAFPYYSILKTEAPFHFVINFYNPSNNPILKMNIGPGNYSDGKLLSELVTKTNNQKKRNFGFEFFDKKLYYKVIEPIFYNNNYIGCIEFGIREDEIVDYVSNKNHITIASYFSKEEISESLEENIADITTDNFFIHTYANPEIFSALVNNIKFNEIQEYNKKHFYFGNIPNSNGTIKGGFKGIYFFKDVSQFQNEYQLFILKSLIIEFLILVLIFIVLFFSFNSVAEKIFNLKVSLEKRLAEQTKEIIEANTELQQIFNTTSNNLRLIDNNFNIIRVNRSFTILSGISKEEAEQKKCYEAFPGPYCHTGECPLIRIKNGEERVELDIKKVSKRGKVIHGISTSVAFTGEHGESIGIIEDFKDITERVDAENALKYTEQTFSEYMNNLPLGVFIKSEVGKMEYLNKFMDYKFSKKVFDNKTPHEIFPLQYANRVIDEDNRALNGELIVVEENVPDKYGEIFTYLTHKFRFRGLDGNWKVGGVALDISQRKKAEYKLKILSNAIQHSPACVVITKLNGEIEFVNPSFTRTAGYEIDEVLGKNISILRNEEFSESIFNDILESVKIGVDWQGEFHNQKKDGELYWELASISAVKNDKGRTTNFVIISEDITERKLNEKELIEAKEKAEEADKLKLAFLANLSHEIRTPMNAIIGFSNILLDDEILPDERKKINSLINSNGQKLLRLIDDVIDISKIQTGGIEINKTDCFLNKMLLNLFSEFDDKIKISGKKVKLTLNRSVRNDDFSIYTDSSRLRQILFNLIDNSVKFTNNGFIEFGYSLDDSYLMFYIVDTGVGILKDKSEHIFELFRQADNTFTREYGGTGIGLTISKSILNKMGGKIWAESVSGEGTTVFFTIPYIVNENKFEDDNSFVEYDWNDKVVLIAEDVDTNFLLLKEILDITKANVLWAKDGEEAVNICRENKNIDLVLMDINLPKLNGFEATQKIKSQNKNLKIIGQTAYSFNDEKKRCLDAGFDNYIGKPISVNNLLEVINNVFSCN